MCPSQELPSSGRNSGKSAQETVQAEACNAEAELDPDPRRSKTDVKELEPSLLAAIVKASPDSIASTDLDGNITSWNLGAERMYGYTAEEIVGQSIATIIPDDRRD